MPKDGARTVVWYSNLAKFEIPKILFAKHVLMVTYDDSHWLVYWRAKIYSTVVIMY